MARKTTRATIIQNSQQNSTLGVAAPNSTERTLALSSGTCGGANTRPGKGKEYCHHSCSERSEKGQKLGGTSTMQLLPQLRGALLSERKKQKLPTGGHGDHSDLPERIIRTFGIRRLESFFFLLFLIFFRAQSWMSKK